MNFTKPLDNYGDLMEIDEFREACKHGCFNDYDGSGRLVKGGRMSDEYLSCSEWRLWPSDITHVMWYGK